MTRWAALGRHPERVWVVWDPDRWLLPVPWEGVALLTFLGLVVPGLVDALLSGRRSGFVIVAAGFLCAVATALLTFWSRRRLRRHRARRARGGDWVCAACLHSEAA